jgi:hypothetical protein
MFFSFEQHRRGTPSNFIRCKTELARPDRVVPTVLRNKDFISRDEHIISLDPLPGHIYSTVDKKAEHEIHRNRGQTR